MTAIKIKGNIEITGGSVTASSEATGKPAPSARYDGIYVEGNFTITGGCVKATSENDSGIYVASDDFTTGSDAESVTVRGYYSGVYVENGNLTINGGRIDSYVTGEGEGICCVKGDVVINGGIISVGGTSEYFSSGMVVERLTLNSGLTYLEVKGSGFGFFRLESFQMSDALEKKLNTDTHVIIAKKGLKNYDLWVGGVRVNEGNGNVTSVEE